MSDAPDDACPAYDALAHGLGTLARAQALHEILDMTAELEETSRVIPARDGANRAYEATASNPVTEPAPPREPASRIYQRVHEELSQFIAPEAAEDVLDRALYAIGAARDTAGSLDFREALVEIVPDRLALLLPEGRIDAVLWALESALVDIHRTTTSP
jgi:hypothetical protein